MPTGSKYATGDEAWGLCKKCGLRFLLRELVFDGYYPGLRVCSDCYDTRQPQEFLVDVTDPTALWKPSPEWGPVNPVLSGFISGGVNGELAWTPCIPRGGPIIDAYLLYRSFSTDGTNYTASMQIVAYPVTYYTDLPDLVENGNPRYNNGGIEAETLDFEDAALPVGFFKYQVFAQINGGRLANSNFVILEVEAVEFNLGTQQSDSSVGTDVFNTNTLNWDEIGADHYDVYRQIEGGGFTLLTTVTGTNTYDDTGNANTWEYGQYDYYVVGKDAGNATIGTSNVSSQTWVQNVIVQGPVQQSTDGTDNMNSLAWDWEPATSDLIDHQDIYRQINGGGYVLLTTVGAFDTGYVDSGLIADWVSGDYDYYIVGLTASDAIISTSNVESTTWAPPAVLTLEPITPSTDGTDNTDQLDWNDVAADHYDIWRQINGGGFVQIGSVSGATLQYLDTGPVNTWIAGQYDYFVLAKDGSGNTLQTSNTESTTWALVETVITLDPSSVNSQPANPVLVSGDQNGYSTLSPDFPFANGCGGATPDPPFLGGLEVGMIEHNSAGSGIVVVFMLETLAQDFFTQMQFTDRLGNVETFLTAAATYDVATFPGYTVWYWPQIISAPFPLGTVPVTFT